MIEAAARSTRTRARAAGRRALIATLIDAGLRIGEATALTWADIDLLTAASAAATRTPPGSE